ncbi:protein SIEVE ELEMENT OCCLUSION B-like [Bidens hawaiensis]|uniref:protein SIEVE ELEMENT OCCLUSION B-like n=1 Tax=Bidens hawaiensis TaxID=980011 RepID=UPI00404B9F33
MLHSKLQHRKSIDEDPILHEINVMLTYDENDQGWAVICHGSNDWMRRSDGRSVLMSLYKYSEWQDEAQSRGFLPALNEHLEANGRPMAPILRFPTRGDRHMFSSLDDNALMKNILATHAPDGTYFDVKPLLQIIEDITHRANLDKIPINGTQPEIDAIVESVIDNDNDVSEMLEAMTLPTLRSMVSRKGIGSGDAHATTTRIFHMLSHYEWDVKAIITLASFMENYGEFWLRVQQCVSDPPAKSQAHLKQMHDVLERDEALKPRFEAGTNLLKAMLDLTHCVVRFRDLPKQYISPDTPELITATALIPTAGYWIIRSILACASILINLIGTVHEHITMTTEAWELSSLTHKISNIHDPLKHQLDLCNRHINERKQIEDYLIFVRVMESPHIDNTKPLKHLIYLKDDQQPLYESSTKNRVSIDILKNKMVLLLISDLDLPYEDFSMLDHIYSEAKLYPERAESHYEVVWLQVVPNHKATPWTQEKLEILRNMAPWYSVFNPSLRDPEAIKYIKEVWHFNHKPLLVVFNPQGRIVNTNALHMMWIWGSVAFPFTSMREEALWRVETWRIEFLADGIEPNISIWVDEGKYICLYGGEDLKWIRRFTTTAQAVARKAGIPLEMLYVGTSDQRGRVMRISDIIHAENLGHVLQNQTLMRSFWCRLKSMFYSKLKQGKSFEDDPILHEINVMLTYDGSEQGWAVICRWSNDWMSRSDGITLLRSLNNYSEWQDVAQEIGFLPALNNHLAVTQQLVHCNRLILPETTGNVPERVVCVQCGRPMDRLLLYRCCVD